MKLNKSKLTWILGLISAILVAALGYLNSSCSSSRTVRFEVDSISVNGLQYNFDQHLSVDK